MNMEKDTCQKSGTSWKEIIKKFLEESGDGYILEDDDLTEYSSNPKSGLDCWIRLDKNVSKGLNLAIRRYVLNEEISDRSITSWIFTIMVISKDKDTAIKALKRFKKSRDWNLFEVESVTVEGIKYYIVFD